MHSRDDWVGHKKVKTAHLQLWGGYPDFRVHAEELLSRPDANTVAVHWTASGTNTGDFRGREPTGDRSTFSGALPPLLRAPGAPCRRPPHARPPCKPTAASAADAPNLHPRRRLALRVRL